MAAVIFCLVLAVLSVCGGRYQQTWHGLTEDQIEIAAREHKEQIERFKDVEHGETLNSILKINCSEIDWTFYYQSPFLHMYLPKCADVIQPRMVLLRPGKECLLDPLYLPNNVTDQCVEQLVLAEEVDEVVIMTHGFLKSLTSSKWMHLLADQLMVPDPVQNKTRAVLLVGWGHGSGALPFRDPLYYYQAAANTRYMGVSVARVLASFTDRLAILTNHLNNPLTFHCIGHSLGAHICGFAGQTLQTISHIALTRISGLDPAGPMFAVDVPYPFNWLDISPRARLNKDDADFVDVIHTDGKARMFWSIVPQYGSMTQMGHVDFFPGAGLDFGWNQPGCWRVEDISSCSHSRSHQLYLFSVSNPCTAFQTCNISSVIPVTCTNITTTAPVMGYWVDPGTRGKVYTVLTGSEEPFCNKSSIVDAKDNSNLNMKMVTSEGKMRKHTMKTKRGLRNTRLQKQRQKQIRQMFRRKIKKN
eukprot:GFUD01015123.1.p1 GENE.GFUD01015123.1~~GFUD01015123.1.p1  ORF type:complete len:473 (-),score=104.59 GFUD01015123.1:73-1491(-)